MTKWVWIYTKTEENVTPCLPSLGFPTDEMQRDCPSFLMNSSPGTPLAHRQASLEPREMKKKKKISFLWPVDLMATLACTSLGTRLGDATGLLQSPGRALCSSVKNK